MALPRFALLERVFLSLPRFALLERVALALPRFALLERAQIPAHQAQPVWIGPSWPVSLKRSVTTMRRMYFRLL